MSGRRTSLARHNLTHQPTRTVVSLGGISFAIVLMFMQLGFLGSVGDTATLVYQRMPCDIVVRSSEYLHVYDPRSLDADVVNHLVSLAVVRDVRPLDATVAAWQNPVDGEYRAVAMLGIDIDRPAIELAELEPLLPLLRRPNQVLVDRTSRSDFGPADGKQFGADDIGRSATITDQNVRIAGTFAMGTGLAANGAVIVSREGFRRLAPGGHDDRVSMALVTLAEGISIESGRREIVHRLQSLGGSLAFAQVLTREEAATAETRHWYLETPIGLIFWIGVLLAVFVGGVICYMVLAADVIAHVHEYATLKALGYSNAYLGRTLLAQAGYLAVVALPISTFAAIGLYRLTSMASGIPIRMTWQWIVLVAAMTLVMCGAAGSLALRKLVKAEPASLF